MRPTARQRHGATHRLCRGPACKTRLRSQTLPCEVDAAILLSRTKRFAVGDELTLAQAVGLIAQIGGYTGKSSGGPPGATVISRGLHDVLVAANAIELARNSG